jgi:hypothetical protein
VTSPHNFNPDLKEVKGERVELQTTEPKKDAVSKSVGVLFLGILLGLALKAALDTSFKNISQYSTLVEAWNGFNTDLARNILFTAQLVIFLITLTRFYWGSYRYHEETPEARGGALALGLGGTVFLFSAFYVTALVVRTTVMFYVGLFVIHVSDFIWFLLAITKFRDELHHDMQSVASWFLLFDVVTGAFLLLFGIIASLHSTAWFVWQWLALASVAVVGAWDVRKFWSFYTNGSDWREKLPASPKILANI